MLKYAVIGAGVSGLSMAGMLLKRGMRWWFMRRTAAPAA